MLDSSEDSEPLSYLHGAAQRVVIAKVEEDEVTVDGNHPLAGVTLSFDVKIVSVRDATEEEISHGHVH